MDKRRYEYTHEEITLGRDEFVCEFIDTLIEECKIPKKRVDSIITKVIRKWEEKDD